MRRLTPHMLRVSFSGPGLDEFPTWPDQQLKLLFPREGQTAPRLPEQDPEDVLRWYQAFMAIPEPERPWMRSYTVRAHHPERAVIDIDFVLHEHGGPATRWALAAKPGDLLGRYGPAAIYARPLGKADTLLLAGDETALPAIGSLLESLPDTAHALVFVEVRDAAEELPLTSPASVDLHWLHRGSTPAGHSTLLLDALRATEFPSGSLFAWIAGEAGSVRALRRHLVTDRGVDRKSVDFTGYWRLSLSQDDAPTAEDLAEAQERTA
ncbi:hypothetical protein KALB_191 [Kutzneria albida DSM 43870]|uniref:FAD-binding FR-type domain-containing protein n=1 Tax=Kutzneria albida DSM 43870 TaxID=1449976 RepID=W5VXJ5_9PSEU|nr:hypothetical protein KALB_191 [Kutzneria albida DSM 43870]